MPEPLDDLIDALNDYIDSRIEDRREQSDESGNFTSYMHREVMARKIRDSLARAIAQKIGGDS